MDMTVVIQNEELMKTYNLRGGTELLLTFSIHGIVSKDFSCTFAIRCIDTTVRGT